MAEHDDDEFGYATIDVSFAGALEGTDIAALADTPAVSAESTAVIADAMDRIAEHLASEGSLSDARITLLIEDDAGEVMPAIVTTSEPERMRRALALALLASDDEAMARIEEAISLATSSAGSDAVH